MRAWYRARSTRALPLHPRNALLVDLKLFEPERHRVLKTIAAVANAARQLEKKLEREFVPHRVDAAVHLHAQRGFLVAQGV